MRGILVSLIEASITRDLFGMYFLLDGRFGIKVIILCVIKL